MGKWLLASVGAAALALSLSASAMATECHPAVTGKSKKKEDSMREAYGVAIAAWEKAAEKKYDEDFDWYYSADRSISCKWKTGKDINCSATARPCEKS
ncbi:MAG: hypothetical protein SFW09_21325 [Hyphomicrobiaceae bacterium]|nr:hypothetical protein [Hyphomicrobiaceae bacterium]